MTSLDERMVSDWKEILDGAQEDLDAAIRATAEADKALKRAYEIEAEARRSLWRVQQREQEARAGVGAETGRA